MQTSSNNANGSEFWRGLPLMLGALLVTVLAVDLLLAAQPAWVEELSARLRTQLTLRTALMPPAHVLASALAVATIVLSSAVLLSFARAVRRAPALAFGSAWVAMCLLSVVRMDVPLPRPLGTPEFLALSALLVVAGGVALRTRSTAGVVAGSLALLLPLGVLVAGCAQASAFGGDAIWMASSLTLAALGVLLIARLRTEDAAPSEIPGLEGVDIVQELFSQVERAERSEARVSELERQLSALSRPQRVRTLVR